MKSKIVKKIRRLDEKINRLLIEKEKIKKSVSYSHARSKVCRLIIFHILGWKITFIKSKESPTVKKASTYSEKIPL